MPSVIVDLAIPAHHYQAHYDGTVRHVLARARDGSKVCFPSGCLRQVVGRDGVLGTFELSFDADHRFTGIRRVGEQKVDIKQ